MNGAKVWLTGGHGFLGTHLAERFARGGAEVIAPTHAECDLARSEDVTAALRRAAPQLVVHAAADVGGLGYNQECPADIFRNNLRMACNVLDGCSRQGAAKLVIVGSACAYPGAAAGALAEADFLSGPMHASVECYGLSKRALYLGARAYRQQHGLGSVFLLVTNLYGPHDKFDPSESHVVAALIRKFVEAVDAGDDAVDCWGTGAPVREFLYAPDCADAVFEAARRYESPEPLNVGTGVGTSIRELAELVGRLTGFAGEIRWDASRPDGVMRKVLDVARIGGELGWSAATGLEDGLRQTIQWYRESRGA
jgi:GDP-L-fucose synthase